MTSQALTDFKERTKEVDQLLEAHAALTRLRKAEKALKSQNQTLQNVADVIQHLVSQPGPGRPQEVHALNNAAVALLSAHLQGFIKDLFEEAASRVLEGKVSDVPSVLKAANTHGNPNEQNIIRLFESIGFSDILELARIGSQLLTFVDFPRDQIGSSSPIDTFATRLSAQPLRRNRLEKYE